MQWSIISRSQDHIRIKVVFKKANYISYYEKPDYIAITFVDLSLFISEQGIMVKPEDASFKRALMR